MICHLWQRIDKSARWHRLCTIAEIDKTNYQGPYEIFKKYESDRVDDGLWQWTEKSFGHRAPDCSQLKRSQSSKGKQERERERRERRERFNRRLTCPVVLRLVRKCSKTYKRAWTLKICWKCSQPTVTRYILSQEYMHCYHYTHHNHIYIFLNILYCLRPVRITSAHTRFSAPTCARCANTFIRFTIAVGWYTSIRAQGAIFRHLFHFEVRKCVPLTIKFIICT